MSEEIMVYEKDKLEAYYNEACKSYGVSCKVLTQNKYAYSDKEEHYLVFGSNGVPDDLNAKDIHIRNERTNALFYPDYYVIKLDDDSSVLSLVEDAVAYCRTVDFLQKLYSEHGLPLPSVIRGDEIHDLKECNAGRNNRNLPADARANYGKLIKKWFREEKSRNKFFRKWREFKRTDKYDRFGLPSKLFRDFRHRDSQIISFEQLHQTCNDLNSTIINEHELARFVEEMKRFYPDVLFSVSEREVVNEGFDTKRDKNKPIHKIKSGPSGKLITYEAFCEERDRLFATKGFEAIKDLNPVYYETRKLSYKEIDEPFIASVLNSIRFSFAKSDDLQTVRVPGLDVVSFIDVPVDNMMNFVSLAKANNVPFYLDFYGKFGRSNLEKIRVVYSASKDNIMNKIVERMVSEKIELSHIPTSIERKPASLDKTINKARHLQLTPHPEFVSDNKNIEL